MTITSGTVIYGDAIKHPGYDEPQFAPSKKAEVHLTFDGDNLDAVSDRAVAKVHELLGIAPKREKIVVPKLVPSEAKRIAASVGLSDKDKLAKEAGLPVGKAVGSPRKKPAEVKQPDPADFDMDEPVTVDGNDPADFDIPDAALDVEEVVEDENLNDLLGPVIPEITDADLLSKITHKNGQTANPKAIRALVTKYSPAQDRPYQAIEIEQSKRAAFLADLAKVPKLVTAGAT